MGAGRGPLVHCTSCADAGGASGSMTRPNGLHWQCRSDAHGTRAHARVTGLGHWRPRRLACVVTMGRRVWTPLPPQSWEHGDQAVQPLTSQSTALHEPMSQSASSLWPSHSTEVSSKTAGLCLPFEGTLHLVAKRLQTVKRVKRCHSTVCTSYFYR